MAQIECPNCKMRVLIKSDGSCPGCGRALNSDPPRTNPYAASIAPDDASHPAPLMKSPYYFAPKRRNLRWLLFSFEGRIPRRTLWLTMVSVNLSFILIASVMVEILNELGVDPVVGDEYSGGELIKVLCVLLPFVLCTWAGIAVQVKRWHDLNKPGVWILINLIPLVGWLWNFIESGCTRGTFGDNLYGPDPT